MSTIPKSIVWSVSLTSVSYLIGVCDIAVMIALSHITFEKALVSFFSILIAELLILLLLLRKNWIRILAVALLVITIPFSLLPLLSSFIFSHWLGLSKLLQMLLQIAGGIFLLSPTTSEWYNPEEE
jgi:hypothetical protein